jgi:hypothetical protein
MRQPLVPRRVLPSLSYLALWLHAGDAIYNVFEWLLQWRMHSLIADIAFID